MSHPDPHATDYACFEAVFGYLNFAEGAPDLRFLGAVDRLYRRLPEDGVGRRDGRQLEGAFREGLERVRGSSPAFQDLSRAEGALDLVFGRVLPGYLDFHRDLLFHQRPETLFNGFLIARAFEAALRCETAWGEGSGAADETIRILSDFVGHRPLATLEQRRLRVDPHEKVRPIPLYVAGAGTAAGPYEPVVRIALRLLQETDDDLLQAAQFDFQSLDELAFDPRAYDFDHPVNRRPNYHFGLWDPDLIDSQGHYRRFVIQQVTLDALHHRVRTTSELPRDELEFEAAAVLAGTILMASGISGRGPGAIDSEITLGQLLARIAAFRDEFYDRLRRRVGGSHGRRLEEEVKVKRQAFGAARQHINGELARQRASQLEHVHLAKLFARMGYLEDAVREANVVPVASARMTCLLDCALAFASRAIEDRRWSDARDRLEECLATLHRGIACGALIDPWNILGFDAHFPLFSGPDNSVHDHRADEMVALMDRIFAALSRFWNEASAAREPESMAWAAKTFEGRAQWWHRFAVHEVSGVEASDSLATFSAARHVADCLALWQHSGAAAGDVGFWAGHAARFDSPTAYARVVEALLDQEDHVASRGLLMHWLGQAEQVPLESGSGASFYELSQRWLSMLMGRVQSEAESVEAALKLWSQAVRWFDHLEANAEEYWRVPSFVLSERRVGREPVAEVEDGDAETELFQSAYEDVVYRDSTDDGVDSSLAETGGAGQGELEREARRIGRRLSFLTHLAKLWKIAGLMANSIADRCRHAPAGVRDWIGELTSPVAQWAAQARQHREGLSGLLREVQSHPLSLPSTDHESLIEYDRRRLVKENLLDGVIGVCVDNSDALRTLVALSAALRMEEEDAAGTLELADDAGTFESVLAAVLRGDTERVKRRFDALALRLAEEPLLYVPLAKGGEPQRIVASRIRRTAIQELLVCLPRLGLLETTHRLIELAREMEQSHPVGQGAVTEFDELFRIGYRAMVEALVEASRGWPEERRMVDDDETWTRDDRLYLAVERLVECALVTWLEHSKTLRLSVLEKVRDRQSWERLVQFVRLYGGDLFTQRFFNLGNLRAILHQGVASWFRQWDEPTGETRPKLVDALDREVSRDEAERWLTLILEAIIENYAEYRDYNSTTTQSDRGEMLYTLLDFLRLRVRYDRVAWHLRPVVWSHEVLVRAGCESVARRWRRKVRQRIGDEPEKYLERLARLQLKYAMQMPSVKDRIHERFMMPMRIDRLRAFVETAVLHPGTLDAERAFDGLRLETRLLTSEPTGAGLEVPRWLASLEDEVERAAARRPWDVDSREALVPHPASIAEADLFEQLLRLNRGMDEEALSSGDPLDPDDLG